MAKEQEGREPKTPANANKSWLPSVFEGARAALRGRGKRLEEEEKKATSYKAGGLVKRGYGKARGA